MLCITNTDEGSIKLLIPTYEYIISKDTECLINKLILTLAHIGLDARKPSLGFANNKVVDQPVHQRSLISAFVILLLKSFL